MNKEQILEIIRKAMDEHMWAISGDEEYSPYIEGKPEFFKEVSEEFDKLFNNNDLSKFKDV